MVRDHIVLVVNFAQREIRLKIGWLVCLLVGWYGWLVRLVGWLVGWLVIDFLID
jgi:hypothetical protein